MQQSMPNNPIALITGASSGIGAETALLLASKGMHVILAARRTDRLTQLSKTIEKASGKATVLQTDLTVEAERLNLFSKLSESNLLPDILVNNAGIAWYGYFNEMPWDIARDILNLNVVAPTHLMQLFLPSMHQKKYGRIINIGSIAGKLPEQGIAVYSASKSYLDSVTTSTYRDLRRSGVTVSILRAGPVKTEFFDAARSLKNGGSVPAERMAISADRVARKVWSLIAHPRRVAYIPFYLALSPLLEILFSPIIDQLGPLLLRRRR